jgi:hypothetical protein
MFDRERLVTGARAVKPGTPLESQVPASSAPHGEGSGAATATLALSRRWGGLIDRNPEWQIEIDGDVVGLIASRRTVELAVEPGRHTLHLRSRRHSSPQRSFEAADGQVVSFWCHAARVWPMYVAALVKPDLWISLKQG